MIFPGNLNGTNSQVQKALNRSMILNLIFKEGPLPRSEIVRRTNLTSAAVTNIVSSLSDEGIIKKVDNKKYEGNNKPGRNPIPIDINYQAKTAIGIHFDSSSIQIALFNLKGDILFSQTKKYIDLNLEQVINDIEDFFVDNSVDDFKESLLGIGIAIPGLVDTSKGIIKNSPRLGWKNVYLREKMEKRFNIPVMVTTSMRAWTAGELCYNYVDTNESFIAIYANEGIGAGLVVNGRILSGSRHGAGEIGHMVIDPRGPRCSCGSRGCLEVLASIKNIVYRFNKETDIEYTLDKWDINMTKYKELNELVKQKLDGGDEKVDSILDDTAKYMAIAIANVINLFNPDYIVVTGPVFDLPSMLDRINNHVDNYVFRGPGDEMSIRKEKTGKNSWTRGAASVIFRNLFYNPLLKQGE